MDAKLAYLDADKLCESCSARALLQANHCSAQAVSALTSIIEIKGPFRSGDHIFRAGHSSRAIYIVRNGAVKCERVTAGGELHVAGFYLSGELFGCEDIGADSHCYDAIALEECRVCEIPIERLENLFKSHPDLQHCFLTQVSERIRRSERILTDSFHMRAKHRLMNFLCDLYTRLLQRRSEIGSSILLPMNKSDIANHLGISPETLSRMLRELEVEGKLRNGIKQIELIDPEMLAGQCKS